MEPAFTLRNLHLGYRGQEVLHVTDLVVPSGGMVFIIGPSGTGKSTLLESVGLMSNTFLKVDGSKPLLSIEGTAYDPIALWAGPSDRLAAVRRERFSFIFQSTNLMPNFTIGENIRMAVQDEARSSEDLAGQIASLMESMHLPASLLNKAAHEVSGGQKQRIAFIRALVKRFSILLADEPTGNLDPANSVVLFRVLKEHLVALGRTAVVVTHHLDLASEFGDMILEIDPANGTAMSATVRVRKSAVPA